MDGSPSLRSQSTHPPADPSPSGNRAFARMDADLVDVPTFGEGWNVGPTLGVNVQPDETQTYTFSAGTTFRSRYEREGVLDAVGVRQTQELQPSTVTTLTAGYSKKFGDLFVAVTGSYATEDATAVDGRKILRSGDRFSIGLNGHFSGTNNWACPSRRTGSIRTATRCLIPTSAFS